MKPSDAPRAFPARRSAITEFTISSRESIISAPPSSEGVTPNDHANLDADIGKADDATGRRSRYMKTCDHVPPGLSISEGHPEALLRTVNDRRVRPRSQLPPDPTAGEIQTPISAHLGSGCHKNSASFTPACRPHQLEMQGSGTSTIAASIAALKPMVKMAEQIVPGMHSPRGALPQMSTITEDHLRKR